MKNKILILICAALCGGLFTSCSDWLDARSEETLLGEDLFSDPDGFRVAVNGIYREVSSRELWGENLTWGMASLLAQHYADNYSMNLNDLQRRITRYEWQFAGIQSITESIWAKGYYIIANISEIIQQTEKKPGDFFIHGQAEKDLILGEMYGMRALIHFEMLRLFAPAPSTGYTGPAIPYVDAYPVHQPERLEMAAVMEKIVDEMEMACELLKPLDTEAFSAWMGRVEHRFPSAQHAAAWSEFVNYRGLRMNWYAATALLARIHMWEGDTSSAYDYAKDVYDAHKAGVFVWTPTANQTGNVDNVHTKRWNEILLSFYDLKALDNWDAVVAAGTGGNYYPPMAVKNVPALFGTETNDYRYSGLYRVSPLSTTPYFYWIWRRPTGTSANAQNLVNYQGPLLTVVRFPEMYHIMIEHLIAEEQYSDARALAVELRIARGTNDALIPQNNAEGAFTDWLVNDMVREGFTEGQVFYMFKRLDRSIFNGATPMAMTPEKWTPPYPNNELSYVLGN